MNFQTKKDMLIRILILILFPAILNSQVTKPELVIGEELIAPGIIFIFEGAIKDHIMPKTMHLPENETNVHIEARVNWNNKNVPKGTPMGGFVPYLHISAKVINQTTGISTFIDLVPHINLVDNFHYARNISLPGNVADLYTVKFNITGPSPTELAMHKDWLDEYGEKFFKSHSFEYIDVDFKDVANAIRD